MDSKQNLTRRDVIKALVIGTAIAEISGIASIVEKRGTVANAAEAIKLIDELKDYSARALGFAHDGGKTKRTDPKEKCGTCKQYKKVASVDGVEVGKCSLLVKGLVKTTGWCRSYVKDEALYKKA